MIGMATRETCVYLSGLDSLLSIGIMRDIDIDQSAISQPLINHQSVSQSVSRVIINQDKSSSRVIIFSHHSRSNMIIDRNESVYSHVVSASIGPFY